MPCSRPLTHLAAVLAASVALGGARPAAAEDKDQAAEAARPHKSVYGTLLGVNDTTNTVMMTSESGEKLAWRFDKDVIAEAEKFTEGAPLIVIYRLLPGDIKRVTALAFPGAEQAPTYVNMTRDRVLLRSAPAVDGSCAASGKDGVTESVIPAGGRAEVLEACWCCAAHDQTCSTTTKSGVGRAYLVQCFE